MSDWTDEARARLEADIRGEPFDGVYLLTRQRADIRAALGEIRRLTEKLQEWSDWEAMLHAQLERVVGGSGRGCDSLVETLRLRLQDREREIDRKERGYAAIIKMERDARDQFRERAEAAEAKLAEAQRKLALWESLPASMREYGIETGDLPVNVGAAIAQAIGTLRAKVQRLRGVLGLVLIETGLQAHKHGCPERLRRPAQWDQTLPCAGCAAEAALRGGGE